MIIKNIVVHATDTFPDMDIGADWIRNVHVNENGWRDIGYHYVIRRNGDLEIGRRCEEGKNYVAGAHTLGLNAASIGIAVVGGKARSGELACNFTRHQWAALEQLWRILSIEYPEAKWSGHNDHDKSKQCPTFDVEVWINEVT